MHCIALAWTSSWAKILFPFIDSSLTFLVRYIIGAPCSCFFFLKNNPDLLSGQIFKTILAKISFSFKETSASRDWSSKLLHNFSLGENFNLKGTSAPCQRLEILENCDSLTDFIFPHERPREIWMIWAPPGNSLECLLFCPHVLQHQQNKLDLIRGGVKTDLCLFLHNVAKFCAKCANAQFCRIFAEFFLHIQHNEDNKDGKLFEIDWLIIP